MATSKSINPPSTRAIKSSEPTMSAPAARALRLASSEDSHPNALACPRRQRNSAAEYLVGLPRIYAQPHSQLDRLIQRCVGNFLHQVDRFDRPVQMLRLDALGRLDVLLSSTRASDVPPGP